MIRSFCRVFFFFFSVTFFVFLHLGNFDPDLFVFFVTALSMWSFALVRLCPCPRATGDFTLRVDPPCDCASAAAASAKDPVLQAGHAEAAAEVASEVAACDGAGGPSRGATTREPQAVPTHRRPSPFEVGPVPDRTTSEADQPAASAASAVAEAADVMCAKLGQLRILVVDDSGSHRKVRRRRGLECPPNVCNLPDRER
jgi:hypothetical protein